MPLRVGFDLDGTVADMYTALRREAVSLFGEEVLATSPATTPAHLSQRTEASPQRNAKPTVDSKPKSEDDQTTTLAMQDLQLTARQQAQLWDHVKKIENFWSTLPELEAGIIARIAKNAIAALGSDLPDNASCNGR